MKDKYVVGIAGLLPGPGGSSAVVWKSSVSVCYIEDGKEVNTPMRSDFIACEPAFDTLEEAIAYAKEETSLEGWLDESNAGGSPKTSTRKKEKSATGWGKGT